MNPSVRMSTLAFAYDWRELLVNWSFPCPACGLVGILRTERESWYQCRHCGYTFGIERGLAKENERRTILEATV